MSTIMVTDAGSATVETGSMDDRGRVPRAAGKRPERVATATSAKKAARSTSRLDTLGHLPALTVTPANAQERAPVGELAKEGQEATQRSVERAGVDQGYTGRKAAEAAASHGIELAVVKLAEARRGSALLPRRWVVERPFAWLARFRRLARDYERLATTLAGLHGLAFSCLICRNLFKTLALSP